MDQSLLDTILDGKLVDIRPGRSVYLVDLRNESENAPTIFFVHGSCASLNQFAALAQNLKEQFHIVAYDLYGCGNSPKPENRDSYSTEEHKADLFAIYKRYASAVNFAVGHSYGCSLVMSLTAVGSVKHLHGIIILGGTPSFECPYIFKLPLWVLNCLQGFLSRKFVKMAYVNSSNDLLTQKRILNCNKNPMFMCKAFYQQIKWAKIDSIRSIPNPALVIHGEKDQVIPLQQGEKLSKLLPMSTFKVVKNAGHQLMEEHPDEVACIINAFLHEILNERKTEKMFIYLEDTADSYRTK